MPRPVSQPAFLSWAQAGFGPELVRLTAHDDGGTSAGKKPVLRDWQSRTVAPADIQEWAREGGNVGLRTRLYPAIDIDIDDPTIAAACERVAVTVLGRTARRTRSNSSRRALLYRIDGAPFAKSALRLSLPDGTLAKVEILGDGQQLAVAGMHPSGVPNDWPDGQPVAARLAPISDDSRRRYLDALATELAKLGCTIGGPPAARAPAPASAPYAAGSRTWAQDLPVTEEALRRIDPDCPYDDWVRVGMALHAKDSGPAGFNAWDSWSSGGDKYPGRERLQTKWNTFRQGATSYGSLLSLAGVSGSVRALTGGSRGGAAPEPAPEPDTAVWMPPDEAPELPPEPRDAPAPEPEDAPEPDETSVPTSLEEISRIYFFTEEGGKHFVCQERQGREVGRSTLVRFSVAEFRSRLANVSIWIPNAEKPVNAAKAWLAWPRRREYLGGVVFDPSCRARADQYNLWQGWPIQPQPGDWSLIRDHIYEVLCAGNDHYFEYVMGWLARLAQDPGSPGEVALVFRGEQGAGKTMAGTAIKRMCGRYAMSISTPRGLTGQFNAHLEGLVFLVADEAVFAGDRGAVGSLKAVLTDPTIFVEHKGVNPVEVRNCLHVMMTTNSEWAVPVALQDRRFAVFDAAPCRLRDRPYFERLSAAVNDRATIAAMLYDLLRTDLSGYSVRDIPETGARAEQKQHSLEGIPAWLCHVLTVESLGLPGQGEWREQVASADLQQSHEMWGKNARHRIVESPQALGRFLSSAGFQDRRMYVDGVRTRTWNLGTVQEARQKLAARLCVPELTLFGVIGTEE